MAGSSNLVVRINGKDFGPMDIDQLSQLVIAGDVYASDYIFLEDYDEWAMVCELENFSNLIPEEPSFKVEQPYIYLYEYGEQTGPFTKGQIIRRVQTGRLTPYDLICFRGEENWRRVRSIPSLLSYFPAPPKVNPASSLASVKELQGKGEEVRSSGVVFNQSPSDKVELHPQVEQLMSHFDRVEVPKEKSWLIRKSNKHFGPYTFMEIMNMIEKGAVNKDSEVGRVGKDTFDRLGDIEDFKVEIVKEKVSVGDREVTRYFVRRKYPRVPFFSLAQLESELGSEPGYVTNLSEGGVYVETPLSRKLKVGSRVKINLLPGVLERVVEASSEVVGVINDRPPGVCLKFTSVEDGHMEVLREYIERAVGKGAGE